MSFTRKIIVVNALNLMAFAVTAQTAPLIPTTTSVAAVPAAPVDALLPPIQIAGKYKEYLNKRYANDTEARAVIRLYTRKQTSGLLWLLGGGAFVGFITTQTGTKVTSSGTVTNTVTPLGYAIAGGVPAIIAIVRLSRFGNESLHKTLAEYDKTHALPGPVAAKIRKSDYR